MPNWSVHVGLVIGGLALALIVGWLFQRGEGGGDDTITVALDGDVGTVTVERMSSGWKIELDAELPRLEGSRYYQAWLKGDGGTMVPIGTFNDADEVTLWAGVSPLEFSTFAVTKERADDNQKSSRDRVLSGQITFED